MSKGKLIFVVGAVIVAAISLYVGWYFTLREGVYVGDDFYYKISEDKFEHDGSNYIEKTTDNTYHVVIDPNEKDINMDVKDNTIAFSFPDGKKYNLNWSGDHLINTSGMPFLYSYVSGDQSQLPNEEYCKFLSEIYFDKTDTISLWGVSVVGILMYALGMLLLLFPEQMYFLSRKSMYKNAELSDSGIFIQKLCGAVLMLFGIVLMTGLIMIIAK